MAVERSHAAGSPVSARHGRTPDGCNGTANLRKRAVSSAIAPGEEALTIAVRSITRDGLVMQEQRARKILQSLVQGIDPTTGEEMAAGTVLQQADVLRALLAGVMALEQISARAQRRAQLPDNVGRSWTPDEERALVTAFQAGDPLTDIAVKHGRTLRAIEARLERLGLLTAEQRVTNNSFTGSPTVRATGSRPP